MRVTPAHRLLRYNTEHFAFRPPDDSGFMFRIVVFAAVVLTIPTRVTLAAESVDFGRHIQPLLREHCQECHGPEEQNGGLRLDRDDEARRESDSGKTAIIPGNPDESELLVRVLSPHDSERMPPEGEPLADSSVELLRRWIAAGAKRPKIASAETDAAAAGSKHWAFQHITAPPTPDVLDENWPRGAIDQFVQRRREASGLQVVADADPIVLLRRATYGVTGLPPTIEQSNAFVQKVDAVGLPNAMEWLADDLLARPGYGQRWGRHWMDWVRYADTAGDNSDYPIPQAYLYRNYIIDSFNDDLPYDQFLTEQIAGDLMPADSLGQRNRQVIATGYLAMARRFGSLVERYPWHLTIEDTIDNVGRTMMGMTLACARCHDHKFDPVTARDYYGLYGIFESTRYPFPGIELFQSQRDFVSLLDEAETQSVLGDAQQETERLAAVLDDHLERSRRKALQNAELEKQSNLSQQRRMRDELDGLLIKARRAGESLAKHLRELPEIPTAYAVGESKPTDSQIQIKGEPTRPGAKVPRGFPTVLGGWKLDPSEAGSTSGRMQLAQWITHKDNPLTARVIVNRVWQRHFGTGIVASTSDFGLRGESPSHPELLDYLANDLMIHGWSLKRLQRQILTSRTYALSGDSLRENTGLDPDNRLLWRFPRRRMDAESIRDSVLMLSGTLDPTSQTKPYPFPARSEWKFTQHHPFKEDYVCNKRSVYLMTKRLTATPYFQTFDGPDPNVCTSTRDQSVTSLQALYFVNNEFLHQQSDRFAERILGAADDVKGRIEFAVRSVLCRHSTAEERELLASHVGAVHSRMVDESSVTAAEAERTAWGSLARSLFRLNEFLYLD